MLDFSHAVIGAGVVGLSISAKLSSLGFSVLLIDKNQQFGMETSSRNSEVVHSGLYYPPNSLKSELCIKGNKMLYNYMLKHNLSSEINKCGKWIVAQNNKEHEYLQNLKTKGDKLQIPLEFLDLSAAQNLEPEIKARKSILNSPSTGIVNSHVFMTSLEAELSNNHGDFIQETELKSIDKVNCGYKLNCTSFGESASITAGTVINSAGLYAPHISRMVGCNYQTLQAKGNYFSYKSNVPKIKRLIYPCPSDHGSLGVHLTIDFQNNIRFGPDFEWTDSPTDYKVSSARLKLAAEACKQYIDIDSTKLVPDYCGLRPKVSRDTTKFHDFIIKEDRPQFINLIGIESPGLTSSLAIAEYVVSMLDTSKSTL